jgi:hypothetical protein
MHPLDDLIRKAIENIPHAPPLVVTAKRSIRNAIASASSKGGQLRNCQLIWELERPARSLDRV